MSIYSHIKFNKPYEELTPSERAIFDADLADYWAKELAKPRITLYLPTAQMNMEDIFAPSDDIHHPNY